MSEMINNNKKVFPVAMSIEVEFYNYRIKKVN